MEETWKLVILSITYSVTFLFGFTGNLWVMIALCRRAKIFRAVRKQSTLPLSASERLRVFIFALAFADLMVLLTIPMTMLNILAGMWYFGAIMCSAYVAIDRGAKLFSVVILTTLSLQRYLVVCKQWKMAMSKTIATFVPLIIGIFGSVLVPILWEMKYTEVLVARDNKNITHTICLTTMDPSVQRIFNHYTFFCGFAIPFSVMAICYIFLVRHVKNKFRERKEYRPATIVREPRYMCELTKSIWRISIFHFTCWAPYWFFVASPYVAQYVNFTNINFLSTWWMTGQLIANTLPCINSAGNWILYAFLNRDVRYHIVRRATKSTRCEFHPVTVAYRPASA